VRKTSPLFLALILFVPGIPYAGVGRSAVATLTQPNSARPAGLAEAYCAEASGADSLGYNPSGLAWAVAPELLVQYHGGFMGDTFLSVGYAQQAGNVGVGASVVSYNSGSVDIIDDHGVGVTATGQRDIAYTAGVGGILPWPGLSAGAAIKLVQTQLVEQYSGSAIAGDAGIRLDIPGTGFSLGTSAQNLGGRIKIAEGTNSLPSTIRAGVAYRYDIEAEGTRVAGLEGILEPEMRPEPAPHRVMFLCDGLYRLGDRIASLALGGEYSFHGYFALRTGIRMPVYGTGNRNGAGTAGIGAKIRNVAVDYALEMTANAALHRVSVGFVF